MNTPEQYEELKRALLARRGTEGAQVIIAAIEAMEPTLEGRCQRLATNADRDRQIDAENAARRQSIDAFYGRPSAPTPDPPQPKAMTKKPPRRPPAKGAAEHYTVGSSGKRTFGRLPDDIRHLIAAMPSLVAKTYMVATLLVDRKQDGVPGQDGLFRVGYGRLAELIGQRDRKKAERAMDRLIEAGLVVRLWRGAPGKTSGYRLLSLARLDIERAKVILTQPMDARERLGRTARQKVTA